ncbi:MAG: PLDc N-terminal domain-containing protein [Actinomycetota bacterium]
MTIVDDTLERLILVGLVVPLFLLWIVAYVDLARRDDFSLKKKAGWGAAMFFGAYVGIAAYFILRPVRPPAGKDSGATASRSSQVVNDLEALHKARADGDITEDNYLATKRQLLGLV